MAIKKLFFTILGWAVFLVVFIIHFVLANTLMWVFPKPYLANIRMTQVAIRFLFAVHGVKVSVKGLHHIPENGLFMFMSNHLSLLDIFSYMAAIPVDFAFVSKEELVKVPLLGWDFKMQNHFLIRRGGGKALRTQMAAIRSKLQETGRPILVFPEGTRSKTGELGPFKFGFFKMASDLSIPIVPCVITGTDRIMRKHSLMIHRGNVEIEFKEPIFSDTETTADQPNRLLEKVYYSIKQ